MSAAGRTRSDPAYLGLAPHGLARRLPVWLVAVLAAAVVVLGAGVPRTGAQIPEETDPAAQTPAVTGPGAQTPTGRDRSVEVDVGDPDDLLTDQDEDLLRAETRRTGAPAPVSRVHFLVFATGSDNLNDTVERYAREQRPELLDDARDSWAPGALVVAVSTEPRRNGIYCGDDVCAALDLFRGEHLDGALEEMKEPLRRGAGNLTAGLLAGARAAGDPAVGAADDDSGRTAAVIGGVLGGGGLIAALGTAAYAVRTGRRKAVAQAREHYEEVSREYGRIAGELDGLDVRAHSLHSALADDELREQWEQVRDRFLAVDEVMGRIGDLRVVADSSGPASTDAQFRRARADIETAHRAVTGMIRAEANVERLFRIEQGDADARRREVGELHEDVLAATLRAGDGAVAAELRAIDARLRELGGRPDAPDFVDRLAGLLVDYRITLEALRDEQMSDLDTTGGHRAPRLDDEDWRPGVGRHGYIPYVVYSGWEQADRAVGQSASGSATTGYSNPSFSGGGGSSSW